MAKLDADDRRAIPSSEYGLPSQRKYPMPDKVHARVAESYASKEYNAGKLSGSEKDEIDRKAKAKLGSAPRDHALSMASADHLHRMGHITTEQHKAIRSKAEAGMVKAKRTFGAIG